MTALLLTALGLGVAGVDPAGAVIAVAALARGVAPRIVLAFAATVVIGTASVGALLSVFAGPRLADIDWDRLLLSGGDVIAIVELLVAAVLLRFAAVRLRRPEARPKRTPKRAAAGSAGLIGLAVLLATSAVTDPTFVGLVVIAGREDSIIAITLAHLLWVLVSQSPLVVLAGAVAMGRQARAVALFERISTRMAPVLRVALTAFLLLAGAFLAADAASQLLRGRFLF